MNFDFSFLGSSAIQFMLYKSHKKYMILPILAVLFYTRVPIIARWIDINTPFFALENGSFVTLFLQL